MTQGIRCPNALEKFEYALRLKMGKPKGCGSFMGGVMKSMPPVELWQKLSCFGPGWRVVLWRFYLATACRADKISSDSSDRGS